MVNRSLGLGLALSYGLVLLSIGCSTSEADEDDQTGGQTGGASSSGLDGDAGPSGTDGAQASTGTTEPSGVDTGHSALDDGTDAAIDATDGDGSDGNTDGGSTDGGSTDAASTDDGSVETTGATGSGGTETDGTSTGEMMPPSEDPFEVGACDGMAWTGPEAAAWLGAQERIVLDDTTIQVRSRTCPGGVCGAWGPGEDWVITYLTYSGGVTTHWMHLTAHMNLVLFDDNDTPQLSMQHETFAAGGYPDDDGMVYDFPPDSITYPHVRAFNQFPQSPSDYIDLDYQVTDGVLVVGEHCAVWTAEPFGVPDPHTEQFAAIFHW